MYRETQTAGSTESRLPVKKNDRGLGTDLDEGYGHFVLLGTLLVDDGVYKWKLLIIIEAFEQLNDEVYELVVVRKGYRILNIPDD